MKKIKRNNDKENFEVPLDIAATSFDRCPETSSEMVNAYGTYNIQPTADNDNDFPAIAQGETKRIKERPLEFFRDENDTNPAKGTSDKNPF